MERPDDPQPPQVDRVAAPSADRSGEEAQKREAKRQEQQIAATYE